MGDEADFIELVIASERAHDWAKLLRDPATPHARIQQCVEELHHLVLSRPAYLEEAREAGIAKILTNLIRKRGDADDELTPLFARALAACCGHGAAGKRVRWMRLHPCVARQQLTSLGKRSAACLRLLVQVHTYDYEGYSVTIQEGLLGEGLGCKVWAVAHILCRRLAQAPALVRGTSVLEIGAGCGVCGILAAKLGASSVVLADCEPAVLRNLARCLALNPEVGAVRGTQRPAVEALPAAPTTRQNIPPGCDSVETEEEELVWNAGAVSIRCQDWNESPRHLASLRAGVADSGTAQTAAIDLSAPPTPQNIDMEQCFDVILGTDILYEDPMAPLVSAVLKHRLAPGGKAYVCCAVREQRIFDNFASKLEELGLSCETEAVWPDKRDPGLFGGENFYEGNFVLMTIANSP